MSEESTLISNIKNLQSAGQNMLWELKTKPQFTNDTREVLINHLDSLQDIQDSNYKYLEQLRDTKQNTHSINIDTLSNQTMALDVIETEMGLADNRYKEIESQLTNKQRLSELNTSLSDKYYAQTQILKSVVLSLVLLFIVTFIKNKNLIPLMVYKVLLIIIGATSSIYILSQIIDIYYRSKMDFSKYDFKSSTSISNEYANGLATKGLWEKPEIPCMGQECCEKGYTYVSSTNKCMQNDELPEGVSAYKSPVVSTSTF